MVDHPWNATDVINFHNGLLHLPTFLKGEDKHFHVPTPAFFSHYRLAFDFSPNAPAPARWNQFLSELWDDPKCHDLLHEWGGYCLSRDTALQKLMMFLGVTRGGKGTVSWVLTEMVGGNVASPKFKNLVKDFGLEVLLDRQLAIFPEAKGSPAVLAEVCDILKSVTGEDPVDVRRKNKTDKRGRLRLKICIQSNENLVIPDNAVALAARQLFLHFTKSFKDQEDFHLKDKLLPELPGIANQFLAGLQRLYDNSGKFTEPESSRALAAMTVQAAAPVKAFVDDMCVLDPKSAVAVSTLYDTYCEWCSDNDCEAVASNVFGADLRSVFPAVDRTQSIGQFRVQKVSGKRPYYYTGVRLKTDKELEQAA